MTSTCHTPYSSSATNYLSLIPLGFKNGRSLTTEQLDVKLSVTNKIELENSDKDSTETLSPFFTPLSHPRSTTYSSSNLRSPVSSDQPASKFNVNQKNNKLKLKTKRRCNLIQNILFSNPFLVTSMLEPLFGNFKFEKYL